MKKNYVLIYLFAILTACTQRETYDVEIRNVGLFDGEKDVGIVNIAINADTIAAIGYEKHLSDSIIDGAGKYVIPGLVNSHSHIWETEHLKEAYSAGVLANMGMHASNQARDSTMRQEANKKGVSLYYSAGVAATVPGGHPTQITPNIETVNDSVSVTQFVNHRISEGVDYIKVIKESSPWFEQPEGQPSLPYDSIAKIIDYTHSKNLKVVIHIGSLEEMVKIAEFKPDGFVHMWYSSRAAELTDEKLKTIKKSGAFVVPTVLVNQKAIQMAEREVGPMSDWAKENFLPMDKIKESIKKVHEHGITLLAGTDNGNFDINWGDDLVNELILYSQSGIENIEALKTATGNPAKVWGIPVGILQVGRKANMLLLDGNPIKDLENLKKINTIWKNGLAE